jgi:hypothetical protein
MQSDQRFAYGMGLGMREVELDGEARPELSIVFRWDWQITTEPKRKR